MHSTRVSPGCSSRLVSSGSSGLLAARQAQRQSAAPPGSGGSCRRRAGRPGRGGRRGPCGASRWRGPPRRTCRWRTVPSPVRAGRPRPVPCAVPGVCPSTTYARRTIRSCPMTAAASVSCPSTSPIITPTRPSPSGITSYQSPPMSRPIRAERYRTAISAPGTSGIRRGSMARWSPSARSCSCSKRMARWRLCAMPLPRAISRLRSSAVKSPSPPVEQPERRRWAVPCAISGR